MRLEGKTAIITGASSGIGRAIALELASRRVKVVLAARNEEKLDRVADEIEERHGTVMVVTTDVTDRLAVERLVRRAVEEFSAIDILVNNAGMGLFAPIAGGNLENMRRLFDVNFWGTVNCIQAAVPYMQSGKRGHIVNVASVAARIAPPYLGIYAATKHAMAALSDSLRSELDRDGINVSTIYPGFTQTNFMESMTQEIEAPQIPPIIRWADPAAVGRRVAQAIRWNLRDAYVSPEDVLAVATNAIAPQLVDWGARIFIAPGRSPLAPMGDITLPREDEQAAGASTGDADSPQEPV
jgi:short-subunit dehydrogenase